MSPSSNYSLRFFFQLTLCALLALVAVETLSSIFLRGQERYYRSDFRAFYSAATTLRENPKELYRPEVQALSQERLFPHDNRSMPYVNPPTWAMLFIPITFLTPATGYLIATGFLGLLALTTIAWLFLRSRPPPAVLVAIFSFVPTAVAIQQTQSSVLSLALITLAYHSVVRGKISSAGLFVGLLCYKPQIGVVGSLLLAVRFPRAIPGIICGAGLNLLLSAYLIDGDLTSYLELLRWYQSSPETVANRAAATMISLQGLPLPPVVLLLGSLTVLGFSSWIIRKTSAVEIVFSIITLTIIVAGWHVHIHDGALLLLPLALLRGKVPNWVALVLGTHAVMTLAYFSPFHPEPFPVIPALCPLLLLFIAFASVRRDRDGEKDGVKDGVR